MRVCGIKALTRGTQQAAESEFFVRKVLDEI